MKGYHFWSNKMNFVYYASFNLPIESEKEKVDCKCQEIGDVCIQCLKGK